MNISMIPNNDVKTIHASQNDTQRKWEFTPFANNKALVSDLPMYIKSLKGNTLVWNQLVQNGNFADTSGWSNSGGTSFTASNNEATFVGNQYTSFIQNMPKSCIGHKILAMATCKTNGTYSLFKIRKYTSSSAYTDTNADIPTSYQTLHQLITLDSNLTGVTLMFQNNANASATINVKNVMLFDLTAMGLDVTADQFRALFPLSYYQFDSGSLLSFNGTGIKTVGKNRLKMPSSATLNGISFNVDADGQIQITGTATAQTDFYLYGASGRYDDMDIISSTYTFSCRKDSTTTGLNFFLVGQQTGTKIGVQLDNTSLSQTVALDGSDKYRVFMRVANGTTINTKVALQLEFGSTATDYEPYTSTTTDLPISTYFPTGMKSAGSVYDELTSSKAITRVGSVDLGSFTWSNPSAAAGTSATWTQATEALSDSKYSTNPAYLSNGTCIYTMETANGVYSERTDNSICINQVGRVQMRSSAFLNKTGAEIKTLLSGVYLYYELATPTEENVNLNLTYPIEDGGTEELLPVNGSSPSTSPIKMDVVEPNGEESSESFTYKETDASFASGTYTMVCKNLEIPLTVLKGKLTGTSVIGMTNEPGFFDAKLKMTDSDGVCYSTKFQLHVERKP